MKAYLFMGESSIGHGPARSKRCLPGGVAVLSDADAALVEGVLPGSLRALSDAEVSAVLKALSLKGDAVALLGAPDHLVVAAVANLRATVANGAGLVAEPAPNGKAKPRAATPAPLSTPEER